MSFHSSQISHQTRITIESKPLLRSLWTCLRGASHQSGNWSDVDGISCLSPAGRKTLNQISLVYGQFKSKCCSDSGAWEHIAQVPLLGRLWHCSLSEVHERPRSDAHTKTLQEGGL
jgi:hypothetical protein